MNWNRISTLVPEVFLDFSSRKRSRGSCDTRGFSLSPRRFCDSLSLLCGLLLISFAKKNQEKPLGPGYCISSFFKEYNHHPLSLSLLKLPNVIKEMLLLFFLNLTWLAMKSLANPSNFSILPAWQRSKKQKAFGMLFPHKLLPFYSHFIFPTPNILYLYFIFTPSYR